MIHIRIVLRVTDDASNRTRKDLEYVYINELLPFDLEYIVVKDVKDPVSLMAYIDLSIITLSFLKRKKSYPLILLYNQNLSLPVPNFNEEFSFCQIVRWMIAQ